jgi:tRNA (cytidine32/uridine32-2'-O)-methyltransferase
MTARAIDPAPATRIRFVLSHTSHPGNIGAAARAIRTMGFDRLVLVAPQAFPHPDATAMAASAGGVLATTWVHADLPQALEGAQLVLGATARRRGITLEELGPADMAARVLAATAAGEDVALVFGNERAGLSNEELARCHAAIAIPTDPECASLNLAQAVQVVAWELRRARLEGSVADAPASRREMPAAADALEGFFGHLAQTLEDIEFHKGRSPRTILQRLRRLFLRARPDERELRILRGILADASRMARLAREGRPDEHPEARCPSPDDRAGR